MTEGRQYHLMTTQGEIAPHCLVVGDPGRAQMIAETYFTDSKKMADYRGYRTFTGTHEGVPMSVVTHGIGGASAGTVFPEMVACGARRLIRVGSCSTLLPNVPLGDSAIVTGAVRLEGASQCWAMPEYPAVPQWRVVQALTEAAKMLDFPFHEGIEATTDCFREGQGRANVEGWLPSHMRQRHNDLMRMGVLCYSMEAATLFTWALTHPQEWGQVWAGAINAIYGNRFDDTFQKGAGQDSAVRIALAAMVLLNESYPIG